MKAATTNIAGICGSWSYKQVFVGMASVMCLATRFNAINAVDIRLN